MTSALSEARAAVASVLETATGHKAYPYLADRFTPPCAFVLPGSPYLVPGSTYGTFTLGLEVVVLVPARVNETTAPAVDQLVDDAVVGLVQAGISVSEVSDLYGFQADDGKPVHAAVSISTSQPVAL